MSFVGLALLAGWTLCVGRQRGEEVTLRGGPPATVGAVDHLTDLFFGYGVCGLFSFFLFFFVFGIFLVDKTGDYLTDLFFGYGVNFDIFLADKLRTT